MQRTWKKIQKISSEKNINSMKPMTKMPKTQHAKKLDIQFHVEIT